MASSPSRKRAREEESEDEHGGTGSGSGESSSESDAEEQDVPVMSHAARRKLRKKPKSSTEHKEDTAPSTGSKRKNSVWVGNLAFKTTSDSLKAFFRDAGEVTRIHLPTKSSITTGDGRGMRGDNRGFAYVDFATEDAKSMAISFSERNLDGRRLLIKDGGDFSGRPAAVDQDSKDKSASTTATPTDKSQGMTKTAQKILRGQMQAPCQTLFLGNLAFNTTEGEIREMFERHEKSLHKGKAKTPAELEKNEKCSIRKVRMGTFEDTGQCKGFAFVDFLTTELATAALVNPRNYSLNGRQLKVEFATPDAVRRGGGAGGPKKEVKDQLPNKKLHHDRLKPSSSSTRNPKNGAIAADGGDGEANRPRKRPRVEDPTIETPSTADAKGKRQTARARPKPGAALALAKRENVAIVKSEGKKIVF